MTVTQYQRPRDVSSGMIEEQKVSRRGVEQDLECIGYLYSRREIRAGQPGKGHSGVVRARVDLGRILESKLSLATDPFLQWER